MVKTAHEVQERRIVKITFADDHMVVILSEIVSEMNVPDVVSQNLDGPGHSFGQTAVTDIQSKLEVRKIHFLFDLLLVFKVLFDFGRDEIRVFEAEEHI